MGWLNLGVKTLVLNEWIYFEPSVNGETFRFTPGNLQGYQFFKSYALVRLSWLDGANVCYTKSQRVYPREGSLVLDFPIPQDIKDSIGGLVREVEVQKRIYSRWRGRSNEPPWTLQIEDYYPS